MKQSEITMNLIQTSRTNPRLSAYAKIFGTFDFDATPMASPGTEIIAHKKQINVLHGTNMEYQDIISAHNWNTIGVTNYL